MGTFFGLEESDLAGRVKIDIFHQKIKGKIGIAASISIFGQQFTVTDWEM